MYQEGGRKKKRTFVGKHKREYNYIEIKLFKSLIKISQEERVLVKPAHITCIWSSYTHSDHP